ncbi:glycosyltransferase [Actinomyces sp. B33]|uniref:glycosyltransferase n=1 Tax=Actinomyces sp. B33 TaxID=2942131 RepID=UPI0023412E06|nr:glycosyltransferase [Actinomyces sp. B33]MDC4232636.1 glycosyltransferase [Actinomyces sp. B33]
MHTPVTVRRPRILVATRLFAPEPAAAALRLLALVEALKDGGADVEVLTSRPPAGLAEEASDLDARLARPGPDGARVRVSRAPVLRDATGAVRGYLPYLSFDLPLLARLLVARRADAVVNEPPPTTGAVVKVACALRRIPRVYFVADIVSDAARAQGVAPGVVAVLTRLEAFALRGASRVLAVSEGVAARVLDLAGRGADVVPNGIDTSCGPVDPREQEPPADWPGTDGPVFVYAGTVAEWLAPEVFIEGFARVADRMPGSRLVFLGQGSAWDALRRATAGRGDVIWHPTVSADEARLWAAHACAGLASIRPGAYDYAYPTKILSSLAAGTPVIYAGPGRAREDVVEGRLGWAVDADPGAVAEALLEAAACPASDQRRDRSRLWAWVEGNRSVRVSAGRAARVVLEAAGRGR